MEVGIIKELDERMNQERLRLIALGRAKEAELGKKEGELFSTVLITEVQHIVRGGFWIAGGYYTLFDKSIKILASSMNDRMSSDEIMLHELAHGLDHATDGFKTRPNYHDERFIAAARTLGAGVSRYVKDSKQRKLEEEYEEDLPKSRKRGGTSTRRRRRPAERKTADRNKRKSGSVKHKEVKRNVSRKKLSSKRGKVVGLNERKSREIDDEFETLGEEEDNFGFD